MSGSVRCYSDRELYICSQLALSIASCVP